VLAVEQAILNQLLNILGRTLKMKVELAFLPTKGNRSGHQGNARTASARLQSRHVYPSSHDPRTQSSK